MNIQSIREHYSVTKQNIFLNHASTCPVSTNTIKRIKSISEELRQPLNRHIYQWQGMVEQTRRMISDLLSAHPHEIAFCQNASSGLSIIANALPLQKGDKILIPRDEFPSNIYPWQNLASKGVEWQFFDVEPGVPLIETLKKQNLDGVKLIPLSAVNYKTGRYYDLISFCNFCRERKILTCVDGVQAIGATNIDVKRIGMDFLVGNGQNWLLGPPGCGFFYVRKELLPQLHVPLVGWMSNQNAANLSQKELDFASGASRFEPGMPNYLPIAGLNQTLKDLEYFGWQLIYSRVHDNASYLMENLKQIGIKTLAEKNHHAGIVSFKLPKDLTSQQLSSQLTRKKIIATLREDHVRISPHFYSTQEEIDSFLEIMDSSFQEKTKVVIIHDQESKPEVLNKSILLSGATGILGKQIALQLAEQGYSLTLLAKEQKKLEQLKKEIKEISDADVKLHAVDFSNTEEFDSLLEKLCKSNNKYHALINAAHINLASQFTDLEPGELEKLFAINFFAQAKLCQNFILKLHAENALGVLNIVSDAGRIGYPLLSAYGASNAALWTLTESIQREVNKQNLTATTFVCPPMLGNSQEQVYQAAAQFYKGNGKSTPEPEVIARQALKAFFKRSHREISFSQSFKIFLNNNMPYLINNRIAKLWQAQQSS